MKLAISNIAWETHDDPRILRHLINNSVSGIEIAPTKLWPDWCEASYQKARQYKKIMRDNGFEIPAMQAIMFGKPELQIFDKNSHAAFLEHIRLNADLANGFESKVLVFGAPKNRRRGQISHTEAMNIAADVFYKAGEICSAQECCLGLEHNPIEYGCDFVTNMLDAKELVEKVDHKGFKLHIDSAGLHMCGGVISNMLRKADDIVHYHISEPMLAPIYGGEVDQKSGIETLRSSNYKNWLSIEMRQPSSVELLVQSVQYVNEMMFE